MRSARKKRPNRQRASHRRSHQHTFWEQAGIKLSRDVCDDGIESGGVHPQGHAHQSWSKACPHQPLPESYSEPKQTLIQTRNLTRGRVGTCPEPATGSVLSKVCTLCCRNATISNNYLTLQLGNWCADPLNRRMFYSWRANPH